MFKKALLLTILAVLGCSRPYDGEKRLVVEGRILDKSGTAIPNQLVEIFVGAPSGSYYFGSREDFISYGNTDFEGRFKLVFPSPLNNDAINIAINDNLQNSIYQSKSIVANVATFKGFRLDVGTFPLYELQDLVNFKIIPVQITPNTSIGNIQITALVPNSIVDLVNTTQNQDNTFVDTNYTVVKNQTFNITYTLTNNSSTTNESVTVNIQDQPLDYTLNY